MSFTESQRQQMLTLACQSIQYGLQYHLPFKPDLSGYDPELLRQQACFVTLNKQRQLRGCIGHLEAIRPLLEDVIDNAYAAAFQDPRFPPLQQDEFAEIDLHISVLTQAKPLEFTSEQDLLAQLQPHIDGLILQDGHYKGTFLPSVWESLPDPAGFLKHLKIKAGLSADYWSDSLQVLRYTTEAFGTDSCQ